MLMKWRDELRRGKAGVAPSQRHCYLVQGSSLPFSYREDEWNNPCSEVLSIVPDD